MTSSKKDVVSLYGGEDAYLRRVYDTGPIKPETVKAIAELLVEGYRGRSVFLTEIFDKRLLPGLPSKSKFFYWMRRDPTLKAIIQEARAANCETRLERAWRGLEEAEGRDEIHRAKELSRIAQWEAGRLLPSLYGAPETQIKINAADSGPAQADTRQRVIVVDSSAIETVDPRKVIDAKTSDE